MTWLRALLNGKGYKNVLEVYMYISNENMFTRVIMKRRDNRNLSPFAEQYFVTVVEESCFGVLISHWKLLTKIRNLKTRSRGEMTDENSPYISNLFVDSDVHSVILILDKCKGIHINT